MKANAIAAVSGCLSCLLAGPALQAMTFHETSSFSVPTQARELIYSPSANVLVLKNTASEIVAIDLGTGGTTSRLANYRFTDMSLSPSGRYVFGADYGGENIGYGTPAGQSYVHRLDLVTKTWEMRTAYIAYNVQAVSDTQIILNSYDQWITFTNNEWGTGGALVTLNTPIGWPWGPAYYPGVYFGDFRYDYRTQRLIHGNSNSSSNEITAFRIVNNEFVPQEGSGIYGTAQGFGGTVELATDGSAFYYGRLQVDALDVRSNVRAFPELIFAATGRIAFGNGNYYDAHTGSLLGSLPFATTVYALNPMGDDFWAYDPATTTVHHFVPDAAASMFMPLAPCRAVDTRNPVGPRGGPALGVGARSFALVGACGIPPDAKSVALNVTAVAPTHDGDLKLYAADTPTPVATALSFRAGNTRANSAIAAVSTDGSAALAVQADMPVGGTVDVTVDVLGFFR